MHLPEKGFGKEIHNNTLYALFVGSTHIFHGSLSQNCILLPSRGFNGVCKA